MRTRLPLLILPLVFACTNAEPFGPDAAASATLRSEASATRLGLMTQNMYVGTDVDALILALERILAELGSLGSYAPGVLNEISPRMRVRRMALILAP